MTTTIPRIVLVDDDYATEILAESLRFRGFDVHRISSAADAIANLELLASADLVILDIIMQRADPGGNTTISGDRTTGMRILTALRSQNKNLPILVFSATQDGDVVDTLSDSPNTEFLSKWSTPSMREFVQKVEACLGIQTERALPQSFIVHGHDDKTKLELKNFLQNTLGLPEPIILHEQPNLGRTMIEKFESYAGQSNLVFVLLTPDDKAASQDESNQHKRRARQNVIFELGYFLGVLGRQSGRVLLLHRGPLEIPSDITGVAYVDISNGVEAAGEQIRKELSHVLQ